MNCDEMRELIPLHAGEELEDNEKVALESHLGQCPECNAQASGYRESTALLAGLKEVDPPSGTYAAIWRAVRREFFPAKAHSMSWALAYAALLFIGLSIGFIVMSLSADEAEPAPNNVAEESANPNNTVNNPGIAPSRPATEDPFRNRSRPGLRWYRPQQSQPSGSFYLPRVRMIVGDGEVDF